MTTRLRKKVGTLTTRVQSTIAEATELLDGEEPSRAALQATLGTLQGYSTRLESLLEQLDQQAAGEAAHEEDNDDAEDLFGLVLDSERVITALKVRLDSFNLKAVSGRDGNSNDLSSERVLDNSRSLVQLPKLILPTFDGNILQWQEFWDSFSSAIHDQHSLSSVDKFNYLNSLLVGEAKLCIAGLKLTSANYDVAISLLQDRFANKQLLINSHYKALMDLYPLKSNDTGRLRNLFDIIDKHIRCLRNLGEDTDSNFFFSLIMRKLPLDIVIKVEEKNVDNTLDTTKLCSIIRNIIVAREKSQLLLGLGSTKTFILPTEQGNYYQNSEKGNFSTAQALPSTEIRTPVCIFCKEAHWNDQCQMYKSLEQRKGKVKGLCFICLKSGHNLKDCKVSKPCVYCKQKKNHHRSLCPKRFSQSLKPPENVAVSPEVCSEPSLVTVHENVILQTAKVFLTNNGLTEPAKVLFDTGSQRSYICTNLASKLNLKSNNTQVLSVFTFGNKDAKTFETDNVTTGLLLNDGKILNLNCNVVPQITGKLSSNSNIDVSQIQSLYPSLTFANGQNEDSVIELLIGNDYYFDLITNEKIEVHPGLYLIRSHVGWILSGRKKLQHETKHNTYTTSFLTTVQPTTVFDLQHHFEKPDSQFVNDVNIKDLWSLDSLGIRDCPHQKDDDIALCHFNETIKVENGRYSVAWPWKEYPPDLPKNYNLSLARLNSLLHRFKSSSNVLQEYDNIIKDQLCNGIIEKAPPIDNLTVCHYIPHHPIINECKTTTKLRIVYDASSKTKKTNNSLNDCLYRGPIILEDLCGLLLRFRMYPVGIVADIEKAFLQLNLQESDRNVTRFLWIKDISSLSLDNNVEEYRFCRVPFGVISSPFLLNATIQHHLLHSQLSGIFEQLKHSFYVDNMITGTRTSQDAVSLFQTTETIFSQASMNLRGWCSNSKTFMTNIPDNKLTTENEDSVCVLGLKWDTIKDTLAVKPVKGDSCVATKRTVLKLVASIFDPLGLFTPVVLKAKLFIQNLWVEGVEWDEELDPKLAKTWIQLQVNLLKIPEVRIPRYVGIISDDLELHCFTDASKDCYATVVYLRLKWINMCEAKSVLLFSKSHLTPKSKPNITIPRLELLGVLIGVRSLKFTEIALKTPITRKILWTDSQCVLHWLNNTRLLPRFVERRLSEIKSHTDVEFRYVTSDNNPADIATRGSTIQELQESQIWWSGPEFLGSPETEWSQEDFNQSTSLLDQTHQDNELDICTTANQGEVTVTQESLSRGSPFDIDCTRFSSLDKLIRTTAYCQRAIKSFQKLTTPFKSKNLHFDELHESTLCWLKYLQNLHFGPTVKSLKLGSNDHLQKQLGLFLDEYGILRCRGRLQNAYLSSEMKFPVLLPKHDHFTNLVINYYHAKLQHVGVQHTLSEIRKHYWIIQGRSQVSKIIRQCAKCRRWDGGSYKLPPFPPLPLERVTRNIPFSYTGLDYFGPLYVKQNKISNDSRKVYGCIFTCLTVRAIHLELVTDMTASEFLLALKRFVSRRGKPLEIYLDNAPQFKLASSFLENIWENNFVDDDVLSFVHSNGCKFNFIPELAPWMGGFYERLISIVKTCLKKTIGQLKLTYTQLETVLCETESILNSRPIVYVSSKDICLSDEIITPGHFLNFHGKNGFIGNSKSHNVQTNMDLEKSSRKNIFEIWKKGEKILSMFWKIWLQDYLMSLREDKKTEVEQKKGTTTRLPNVGETVLIHEKLPRGSWKMGRIIELHSSRDGKIRSATVILSSKKKLIRPLNLLYPLEVRDC